MEFSWQEYWSGLPFPSPGDLPNPGIEPRLPNIADRGFTVWATRGSLKKIFFYFLKRESFKSAKLKKNVAVVVLSCFLWINQDCSILWPAGPGFDKDYSLWSVRCCIPWVPTVCQALASCEGIDKWCCWALPCRLPQDCRRDSKLQTRRTVCSVWSKPFESEKGENTSFSPKHSGKASWRRGHLATCPSDRKGKRI